MASTTQLVLLGICSIQEVGIVELLAQGGVGNPDGPSLSRPHHDSPTQAAHAIHLVPLELLEEF